ncbi:DUF1835 domain-containing protein [Roseibium sp.]|uniref:DUF1835 domain-containing protein n=1 Tax=Roseibium sp. TaxID=1936156 RepID=UPI003A978F04
MTDNLRDAQDLPLLSSSDLSLNLDLQKKHAKALRDAARAGNSGALERLMNHHPRARQLDAMNLKLADAQLVIAREAGLPSWPALKRHVGEIDAARQAIEGKAPAPDADMATLHIRCGNDIERALQRAGFAGDFLMSADPVCQGPVLEGPEALRTRARFIAGEYPGQDEEENLQRLREAEDRVAASGTYGRIVLWFEHDPYDQLLLVTVLRRLNMVGATARKVELISLNSFPGIAKFIGIGQLSPAALRHMYGERKPVPEAAYKDAEAVWKALIRPDPTELHVLSQTERTALPFLAGALTRYLQELPDSRNGLSFTEQTVLQILSDGPMNWGRIFAAFMRERDPLPYHGDLMFLGTLLRLRDADDPALASSDNDFSMENWGKTSFSLTPTGKALVAGEKDWKTCGPRLRQHGGVTCFAGPDWRWDKSAQRPVRLE